MVADPVGPADFGTANYLDATILVVKDHCQATRRWNKTDTSVSRGFRTSRAAKSVPIAQGMTGEPAFSRSDHARLRIASRWLLPVAGAAAGILLSATAAHATVTDATFTGAAHATTADPLTWNITADSPTISCELDFGGTPVVNPKDCSTKSVSFNVTGQPAGTYSLLVYDAAWDAVTPGTDAPAITRTVDVAPPAPTLTGPSGPSKNRTPSFAVSDTDGDAVLTCAVTGPAAGTATGCGPNTDLSLPGSDGTYTVTATATEAGLTTDTSVSYALDTQANV